MQFAAIGIEPEFLRWKGGTMPTNHGSYYDDWGFVSHKIRQGNEEYELWRFGKQYSLI